MALSNRLFRSWDEKYGEYHDIRSSEFLAINVHGDGSLWGDSTKDLKNRVLEFLRPR